MLYLILQPRLLCYTNIYVHVLPALLTQVGLRILTELALSTLRDKEGDDLITCKGLKCTQAVSLFYKAKTLRMEESRNNQEENRSALDGLNSNLV